MLGARLRRSRRIPARVLTVLSAVVIVAAAVFTAIVVMKPAVGAALVVSPPFLLGASVALIAWALIVVFVEFDLVRCLGLTARRVGATAVAFVTVAVVSGTLLTAASFTTTQRTTIDTIFAGGAGLTPTDGRYSILLAGTDVAPGRSIVSPDSISIVSVDAVTGKTVVIGVARNTQNFPFPAGSGLAAAFPGGNYCQSGCSLNHAYDYGVEHPELYPGSSTPGIDALTDAVTGYTGLTISGYVLVDMQGFADLVDAVGGVTVQVNTVVPRTGVPNNGVGSVVVLGPPIEPGLQHMDGQTALWFARSRLDSSDTDRMIRQGCLQQAIFAQLTPDVLLSKFNAIESSGAGLITTNIPSSSLGEFARLAVEAKKLGLTRVDLSPPLVVPELPDLKAVKSIIASALNSAVTPADSASAEPRIGDSGQPSAAPTTPQVTAGSGPVSPICSVPLS